MSYGTTTPASMWPADSPTRIPPMSPQQGSSAQNPDSQAERQLADVDPKYRKDGTIIVPAEQN